MTLEKAELGLRESLEDNTVAEKLNINPAAALLSFSDTEVSQNHLFYEIPSRYLEPVLAECSMQQLQKGDILLSPDQENHQLYLLVSGQLQVYLDKADARTGFPIAPGECIGEMSFIEQRRTSAFVIADEESSLIVIPEDIFWSKFIHLPNAVRNLLRVLTNRTRKDNEVIRQSLEQQLRYEHFQKELKVARNIQANILPQEIPLLPNHPRVDVCAMMEPAKEVGGDFYDAFALDKNTICIAIGDVSGKGMPAALFMMRAITLLRMSLSKDTPFESVLPTVNRLLCENNDGGMFVTLFVGLFEVTTGTLTYMNAGHNPPFFSGHGRPFHLLDLPKGMLLGIHTAARYEVATRIFQPGDMLVLYTDGVTEAQNSQQEFYSVARACDTLQTVSTDDNTTRVVKALSDSVSHFSKGVPQSDDITILVLRYRGNA